MKPFYILILLFSLIACNKDDNNDDGVDPDPYNFEMEVAVSDITLHEATITWNEPLPSEWKNVVYRIVLNNGEIANGLQTSEYTFTNLDDNKVYNGTVYAIGNNGQKTSANFSFTTQPYVFEMAVEIGEIGIYEASISWNAPLPSEWGSVVYKVVLNNEVIVDGLQNTNYTISDLDDNRGYNGTVFAKGTNGDETFAHFSFTTLPFTIHYGTLTLTTQEQVDNFFYTECNILQIQGNNITDLSPLASLKKVSSISINGTSVKNLQGLENVNQGGFQISIIDNPFLENISGLNSIYPNANGIALVNNSSLTDVSGLAISDNEYNRLIIKKCPITELPSFGNMSFFYIELENLPIQNFSAFRNTPTIFFFYVQNMPNITGFQGLDSLENLYELQLFGNPLLTNLNDLETLTGSPGTSGSADKILVNIFNNPNLTSFCGLTTWFLNTDIFVECIDFDCQNTIYHFNVNNNGYNPTELQIESPTECSI